jgi:hypothetical protein
VGKAKSETGEKPKSIMGLVRAAMAELGNDAKPLDLQAYIKTNYNEELHTQIISNYKFQIKKKLGTSSGKRGPGRPAAAAGALRVEDFEAVRGLVSRLGADQVKRLIDVVG